MSSPSPTGNPVFTVFGRGVKFLRLGATPPWLSLGYSWPLGSNLWSQIPRSACSSQLISGIPSRHALVTLRMFLTKISFPWMGFSRNESPQLVCTTSVDMELGGSIQDPPFGLTCPAVLAIDSFPFRSQWLRLSGLGTPPKHPKFLSPSRAALLGAIVLAALGSLLPPSPHSRRA